MEAITRYIERDEFSTIYYLKIPKGDILNRKVKLPTELIDEYNTVMSEFSSLQTKLEDLYYAEWL